MTKFSSIYIGSFLIFISILSFINIIYSNYFDIFFNIETYVYTFAISFILGSLLFYLNRKSIKKITLYEKIFTVLLGYFLFPLIISTNSDRVSRDPFSSSKSKSFPVLKI